MMKITAGILIRGLLCCATLSATAAAASQESAPLAAAPAALAKCSIYTTYADKRPYESAASDPFYAAYIGVDDRKKLVREGHLVIRTDTGLYEKDEYKWLEPEFTLPTHERVVSAWIDATRATDGRMVPCIPTGAFFVDGYNGVAFSKRYLKEEKGARGAIDTLSQTDVGFGIKVRRAGRRPAGGVLPLSTTCALADRPASINAPLAVAVARDYAGTLPPVIVDIDPAGTAMRVDVTDTAGSRDLDDLIIKTAKEAAYTPERWKCMNVPGRIQVAVQAAH